MSEIVTKITTNNYDQGLAREMREGEPAYSVVQLSQDGDPASLNLLTENIYSMTQAEPDKLVPVPREIIKRRLVHGRTLIVCEGIQDCLDPVSTVNLTDFGELRLSGQYLPYRIVELSTGLTRPAYRKRGIMSGLLRHFSNPENCNIELGFSAPLVFGTIQPDNLNIRSALKNAKFLILDQRKVWAETGLRRDDSETLQEYQEDSPFASYLLHTWPADPRFGMRNREGLKPAFMMPSSVGARSQSLAISQLSWPAFVKLNSDLEKLFGDLDNLVRAVDNVRENYTEPSLNP